VLAPPESESASNVEFARCLAGEVGASCFSAAAIQSARPALSFAASPGGTTRIGPATVADGIPDPPSGLTFSVSTFSGSASVFLSWRAPTTTPAPVSYLIEAGSAAGLSDVAAIQTVNAQTYFSTSVSGGGTFYVRVRSVGTGGASGPSNEVVITLLDPRLPGAPCCLTVSAAGQTVTLTWFGPFGGNPPTTFVIQASSRAGGPSDLANFATGNTLTRFTASGVAPGTYFLRVLAANSAGVGPPSPEASLIVIAPTACTAPPSVPTNLVPLVTGSTVTLGWSLSTGIVSSYVIEAGSAPGLADLAVVDTGATLGTATFMSVARGTYYARVRGKNSCGSSAASAEVVVIVT
jgi:predicted phage tail protein